MVLDGLSFKKVGNSQFSLVVNFFYIEIGNPHSKIEYKQVLQIVCRKM